MRSVLEQICAVYLSVLRHAVNLITFRSPKKTRCSFREVLMFVRCSNTTFMGTKCISN